MQQSPFDLLSSYPQSGQLNGYYPDITYSDVYFLEPESRSDQSRFLSIVRTGATSGYYIDIFRSKKQRKGDKFHDYYYHNLGQELFVGDMKGQALNLQPSEEPAFAGGHLFALDYMWDKKSAKTNEDYQAVWKMSVPGGNHVYMNLWMKGYPEREVFSIKAPPTDNFRGNHGVPYNVGKDPFLTIVARQHGEAWDRPFVSIFEPATEKEGKSILSVKSFEVAGTSPDFVGLVIRNKSGRTDYIFSSTKDEKVSYGNFSSIATYALGGENEDDFVLFLGNGTFISGKGFSIEAKEKTSATLEYRNGEYFFTCEAPVTLTDPKGKIVRYNQTTYSKIKL